MNDRATSEGRTRREVLERAVAGAGCSRWAKIALAAAEAPVIVVTHGTP